MAHKVVYSSNKELRWAVAQSLGYSSAESDSARAGGSSFEAEDETEASAEFAQESVSDEAAADAEELLRSIFEEIEREEAAAQTAAA